VYAGSISGIYALWATNGTTCWNSSDVGKVHGVAVDAVGNVYFANEAGTAFGFTSRGCSVVIHTPPASVRGLPCAARHCLHGLAGVHYLHGRRCGALRHLPGGHLLHGALRAGVHRLPGRHVQLGGTAPRPLLCAPRALSGAYNALATGTSACTVCAAGAYGNVAAGSTSAVCTACVAGAYNALTTGTAACTVCAAGAYGTVGTASTSAVCTVCVAGAYNALTTGTSACTSCGEGAYTTPAGCYADGVPRLLRLPGAKCVGARRRCPRVCRAAGVRICGRPRLFVLLLWISHAACSCAARFELLRLVHALAILRRRAAAPGAWAVLAASPLANTSTVCTACGAGTYLHPFHRLFLAARPAQLALTPLFQLQLRPQSAPCAQLVHTLLVPAATPTAPLACCPCS
jgi:hypothetical protein